MSFFPYFVCALLGVGSVRGGLAEGNRIFETDFFDTLTIQNDQISHVKHVLAPLYVFFRPLVVNLHVVRLPSRATTFLHFPLTHPRFPLLSPSRLERDG